MRDGNSRSIAVQDLFLAGVSFVNISLNDHDAVRENGEKMVSWFKKKTFLSSFGDVVSEFSSECSHSLFSGGWLKGHKGHKRHDKGHKRHDATTTATKSSWFSFFWSQSEWFCGFCAKYTSLLTPYILWLAVILCLATRHSESSIRRRNVRIVLSNHSLWANLTRKFTFYFNYRSSLASIQRLSERYFVPIHFIEKYYSSCRQRYPSIDVYCIISYEQMAGNVTTLVSVV